MQVQKFSNIRVAVLQDLHQSQHGISTEALV